MKKIIIVLAISMFAAQAYAIAPYLYANTSWGALGGGLGFDLGDGKAIDLSATGASGNSGATYQLYIDYYFSNWGVGVTAKKMTVGADLAYDLSLLYALEKDINDNVTVGAQFTMLNYNTAAGADPNWTFMPSIGAYVRMPL